MSSDIRLYYTIGNLFIPHPFLVHSVHARTNPEMCTSCFHNLESVISITDNSQNNETKNKKVKKMKLRTGPIDKK